MTAVTIYSTPTCPYCHSAKDYFTENKVEFTDKDVMADEAAREEMIDLSGQLGVPVITVQKEGAEDPEVVIGFNKGKLAKLLGIKE